MVKHSTKKGHLQKRKTPKVFPATLEQREGGNLPMRRLGACFLEILMCEKLLKTEYANYTVQRFKVY